MDNNKYIKTSSISYKDINDADYTLSASLYKYLSMPNTNTLTVRDFLSRPLQRKDLGIEVGYLNYINQSPYYFLRAKALQEYSFLPEVTKETMLPIMPQSFIPMNLKEGDLIISKDSNIGEIVVLDKDYPNVMLSSALYKLPVNSKKYYLLAFIKHSLFREQLDVMVPKGATIRHAKTLFLNCKIPMPNKNKENTIKFVELLTKAIVNKEKLIKARHHTILSKIEQELLKNRRENSSYFEEPTFKEIYACGRLDTGMYSAKFKNYVFIVKNYYNGCANIYDLGFTLNRGQNLQETNIGKSIYTNKKHSNFYTLVLPTYFSDYGTVWKFVFLGNSNHLKTLNRGELVFGAEGTFRSIVILGKQENFITNIHGVTLYNPNLILSIFVKCYMDFLREKGIIDCVKVGGHGGSFAQKYWDAIPFPKFPPYKQKEIAQLYHNPLVSYNTAEFNLDNFIELDNDYNSDAGIYELDETAKMLKEILNTAIDNIANNKEVNIKFENVE